MRTVHTHAINAFALPHVSYGTVCDAPTTAATVGDDGLLLTHDLTRWDTVSKIETLRSSRGPLALHACAWVGCGNDLVCSGGSDRVARVWDVRSAQQVRAWWVVRL